MDNPKKSPIVWGRVAAQRRRAQLRVARRVLGSVAAATALAARPRLNT